MDAPDRKIVKVSARLSKFIGAKATREKKLQAASMQAEFTLRDTLIMLCYLGRDSDEEIASKARTNLIPAARAWHSRADRPDLPEPVLDIVQKVIERVGPGEKDEAPEHLNVVQGHIGLLGLGEIIQAVDHNNRTVWISIRNNGDTVKVFTENGKVVGAVSDEDDGLEALYQAFGWPEATFSYMHEAPGDFNNRIKVNTLNLVMDALERAPDDDPFDTDVSLGWKVEGHLKILNVFEIAEIFEMNSKRAMCKLFREDQEGVLYFGEGRIINAFLGDMTGMDAACHLLAWPNARFLITRGGEDVEDVIHIGMQNLIIEAMRLLDEGVTVSDRINTELQLINELFEGRDVVSLPVLDRVRLVFGDNEQIRDVLESDDNPIVRKAVKVKISKIVHKYLSSTTDVELRLKAARGLVPLSTTEKLVLLSYLSHDEVPEVREQARETLESLDTGTYRKGLASDLHPSVMDYLVRETIREESIIKIACAGEAILPQTALYILDHWKTEEVLGTLAGNTKLLESSGAVTEKLYQTLPDDSPLKKKIEAFEESLHQGFGDLKVEGPIYFCGLGGLLRAALRGSRTGTIVIRGAQEGAVFFSRGKTIGAVYGDLEGQAAIEAILADRTARFLYILRSRRHVENLDPLWVEKLLDTTDTGPFREDEQKAGLRLITGSLDVMDVFEVLSALEGTPEPVLVSVMCEEGSGEIYRDANRILHVEVQGKEGPYAAMAAILSWSGTRFLVRYAEGASIPVTVDKTLADFFVESIKQVPDELKQVAKPGELPEWELSEAEQENLFQQILHMGVAEKIKLALKGSKEARGILIRDSNKLVAVAVVKSPKIQESEIETIAKTRSVPEDVLRHIASSKEWMRSYTVKLNLASNSKTPVPIAMKILPQLREYDLRKLAKSKEVSSGIASHARRLAEVRAQKHG